MLPETRKLQTHENERVGSRRPNDSTFALIARDRADLVSIHPDSLSLSLSFRAIGSALSLLSSLLSSSTNALGRANDPSERGSLPLAPSPSRQEAPCSSPARCNGKCVYGGCKVISRRHARNRQSTLSAAVTRMKRPGITFSAVFPIYSFLPLSLSLSVSARIHSSHFVLCFSHRRSARGIAAESASA